MTAGNDDAWPQLSLNKNFASPAFGGFNPCGGNPHVNTFWSLAFASEILRGGFTARCPRSLR